MSPRTQKMVELVGGPLCGDQIETASRAKKITLDSQRTGRRLVYASKGKGMDGLERFWFTGYEKKENGDDS